MISKTVFRAIFLSFLMSISLVGFSSNPTDNQTGEKSKDQIKRDIKNTIEHHLKDSYSFEITHGVSFPLPVILWDNGLHVFMSSKFGHHGEEVAQSNGSYYKLYHGKIYKTNEEGIISLGEHLHPLNEKPLDFSITKNVFVIFLMALLIFFLFKRMAQRYSKSLNPGGSVKFLEPLVLFVRDVGIFYYPKVVPYFLRSKSIL